ncbi:hypothetical protein JYT16_02020 [Gemmatimonas aurantiaca]|nr:hypothetical protein [Gemmatimonas aurantiaca]
MKSDSNRIANVIVLTGLSGSGKSEVGRALGRKLNGDFTDLDKAIAAEMGMSIQKAFAEQGEHSFRIAESKALKSLLVRPESIHAPTRIIALGGGALLRSANVNLAMKHGVLIWLQVSCVEAAERLADKDDRPLTTGSQGNTLSRTALIARLRKLLVDRNLGYAQADIRIKTTGKSVADVCNLIIRKMNLVTR